MKSISYILLLLCTLTACVIPEAEKSKEKHLLIVSDYLDSSHVKLFRTFMDQEAIEIEIKHLNANNIIGSFRNLNYGTGIDLIMLESLYDVNRISKLGYLQPIDWFDESNKIDNRFYSKKYNFIGIGLDPFVFIHDPDSISPHRTYSDLKNHPFYTNLSEEELIPLYGSILSKMNKVDAYNWIKACKEQQQDNSYTTNTTTVLTKYSQVSKVLADSSTNSFSQVVYPNQNVKGTIYDLRTVAIVKQAEDFTEAKKFIDFCLAKKNNEQLNAQLNTAPITSHQKFRSYKVKSEELLPYYGMTQRILNKLD